MDRSFAGNARSPRRSSAVLSLPQSDVDAVFVRDVAILLHPDFAAFASASLAAYDEDGNPDRNANLR